MEFKQLQIIKPLLRALAEKGYTEPTPIQAEAIPAALRGCDLLGTAQTGTGKTAAFAIPILQHLAGNPVAGKRRPIRALVLTPTRELAMQVQRELIWLYSPAGARIATCVGGMDASSALDKFNRMEEKVTRQEAEAQAFSEMAGVTGSAEEKSFEQLQHDMDVDAELQRLMAEMGQTETASETEGSAV